MPYPNRMRYIVEEEFEKPLEEVIPALMTELNTPHFVAARLGVSANSVRKWLLNAGWTVVRGKWYPPKDTTQPVEEAHAH